MRSHRYLREIILIIIFHVFFWGFLYSNQPEDTVWTVFGVFALLLTLISVPSIFYLEKKNSLYFVLIRPGGRFKFLVSKLLFIFLVDFFWVLIFAVVYGLRFLDAQYFLRLIPRMGIMAFLLLISILIVSLSFSYKPWISWLLMVLIVFGGIVNKSALFPVHSFGEFYKVLSVLLPPFQELIYAAVTLDFPFWRNILLIIAGIQIFIYFALNYHLIQKKDFV